MSIQSHFSLTFWTLNSQDLLNVILTQDIRIWIAFPSDCKSIRSICTGFILLSERNCGYKHSDFIVWNKVIHRRPDFFQILGKSCPLSVCLSGRTRTRQSCPDFHCPCPSTSGHRHQKNDRGSLECMFKQSCDELSHAFRTFEKT